MKTLLLFIVFAQLSHLTTAQSTKPIIIGQIDSLQSKILNEKRIIWVHIPKSYSRGSTQRYPVVYLLDGDSHFSSVVSLIEQFSTINGNMLCPEMIVVGIPNTDRTRDLTPTSGRGLVPSPDDSLLLKMSGGGENFTAFIERELMPYIDSLYPTLPYRVFIGHSFGGLMVINTLVHHPNLFNAYVAIDPSMWWDSQKLLNESRQVFATQQFAGKSLFVGIANTMEPELDTLRVLTDTTTFNNHIRSILRLNQVVKANSQNRLRYLGKYYDDENHGSVPLISEYDALRFIFKPFMLTISAKIKFTPTFKADSAIVAYYQDLSRQMSSPVLPPEPLVNRWAYEYLARGPKFLETAGALFKRNVLNYPLSANVYDSYGDYFLVKGDTPTAIVNFKKALALEERAEWRQKLTALQAKVSPKSSPADKPKK